MPKRGCVEISHGDSSGSDPNQAEHKREDPEHREDRRNDDGDNVPGGF